MEDDKENLGNHLSYWPIFFHSNYIFITAVFEYCRFWALWFLSTAGFWVLWFLRQWFLSTAVFEYCGFWVLRILSTIKISCQQWTKSIKNWAGGTRDFFLDLGKGYEISKHNSKREEKRELEGNKEKNTYVYIVK